ncbi:MAG: hypothetical protein EZS28_043374, partial [Streblomastix strix]
MGGKTIRYLEAWKLVKRVEFIQKVFFLLFKNEDSEKILQEGLRICPFSGSREEEIAYTEKLEEELKENIIEEIHPEQVKWFNPKIYNSETSLEIEENSGCELTEQGDINDSFKMNGTDQMRDLIRKGDWTTSLHLKSAFHHLIVYPPHRSYLAFEAMGKVYQNRAMPNGSNEDTERVRYKNFELRRRSAPPTLEQREIAKINLDKNENIWKHLDIQQPRRNAKQNRNNRLTSQDGFGT